MFYQDEYDQYLASIGRGLGTRRHHRAMVNDLATFLAANGIDDAPCVRIVVA